LTAAAEDPIVAWLLRHRSGLREGGLPSEHEVLATYWSADDRPIFAFCRHGLLLEPGEAERYVPYEDIADAGYYNREMVLRAKEARSYGSPGGVAPLIIRLESGEQIELPLEIRNDGMPDLLIIAGLIHRRAFLHRAGPWRSQ